VALGDVSDLDDLQRCFDGAVPLMIATVSGDGTPNMTYLSKAHRVDADHIALSNQFMSKSARNLIEHPRASIIVIDPPTHSEFRLSIVFERTERRGEVFDRMQEDIDLIASFTGMQSVFRLRAADIYRVTEIERRTRGSAITHHELSPSPGRSQVANPSALSELTGRISRCGDLDMLVRVTVDGLADLLGYEHSMLLLVDEAGDRLFTIASHGFTEQGIGAEVAVGEGVVGLSAARCQAVSVGNLMQLQKYGSRIRKSFEQSGEIAPGHEVPMPGLEDANSRMAVPAMAMGRLVGVLVVESRRWAEFSEIDESALSVVASLVASAVESIRAEERRAVAGAGVGAAPATAAPAASRHGSASTLVRFFPVDGSTFLDGDYLIKGVAGRLLWTLLRQHERERRTDFTNREVRLDPSLDLPDFKDNFESRLILLKRRLDERDAPIRIEKTGRGRFRLVVDTAVRMEEM
jgi:adenylate cyclase